MEDHDITAQVRERFGEEVLKKLVAIQQVTHQNLYNFYLDVGDEVFDFFLKEVLGPSIEVTLEDGTTVEQARQHQRMFHPDQAKGKPTSWE